MRHFKHTFTPPPHLTFMDLAVLWMDAREWPQTLEFLHDMEVAGHDSQTWGEGGINKLKELLSEIEFWI